ncbi:MAG TPA: type II toxin-antitoxin system Phd/YefM family antitoxin [Longimicrobiaceae bacterium]
MQLVNIHAAKTNLSRLIERAQAGEDIVIARNNEPVVRLVPIQAREPRRQRGSLEGQVIVPDSFFEPLPPEELDVWGQ